MARSNPNRRRKRLLVRYVVTSLLLLAAVGGTAGAVPDVTDGPAVTPGSAVTDDPNRLGSVGESKAGDVVTVYPNPILDGDDGEYVLLSLPRRGNWTLSDGESSVSIRNHSGYVAVTPDPSLLRARIADGEFPTLEDASVVLSSLALSNVGERLTLRRDGVAVHRLAYGDAPEGERYVAATESWRPVGFSPRTVAATGPAYGTAFVLPDTPDAPVATLDSAERRILLAGYTFASPRVGDALVAAAKRNVTVRVLVEAAPVGGISRRQARLLDRLEAAGVEVRVVGTSPARYAFHHPW